MKLFLLALVLLGAPSTAQRLERSHAILPIPATPLAGNETLVTRDFDSDGDMDLVTLQDGALVALRNDGTGRFAAPIPVGPAAQQLSFELVLVEDLSGDGLADVVGFDVQLRLFVQEVGGGFTERVGAFPATLQKGLHALDDDGDGDLDVVNTTGTLTLARNDGSGVFTLAPAVLPSTEVLFGTVLDAEGDGDPDVFVVLEDFSGAFLQNLLRNDGAGGFGVEGQSVFQLSFALSFEPWDVDLDGDLDLATPTVGWASNDGSGKFLYQGGLVNVSKGTLLDWNGDQRLDAIVTGSGARGLELWRGEPSPGQLVQLPAPGLSPFDGRLVTDVAAADLDGDGDQDLVVLDDGRAHVLWGDGMGGFALALTAPERVGAVYDDVRVGDVDGDGALDGLAIEVDDSGVERVVWVPGDGHGAFAAPLEVAPAGAWVAVGLLDLENDGDADALLVDESVARAWRNDALGAWTTAAGSVAAGSGGSSPDVVDVLVGDLTGDGLDDAVLVSTRIGGTAQPDYVLWNDGSGELVDAGAGLPSALQRGDLGDLDLDGDLDLVALASGATRTYLNRGDGVLEQGSQQLSLSTNRASLRVRDLDLSGAPDLALVENLPARRVRIFEGLANGLFGGAAKATLARQAGGLLPTHLATPDVDADGLPELVVTDGTFWANRGGWTFEDRSAMLPVTGSRSFGKRAAVADLDGDGDDDVWMPGDTQVWWSLRRQLRWVTWPRLGKPLVMEVSGSPGGFWIVWASPATASIPLGLGTLLLEPSQAFGLGSGVLDGSGSVALSFVVPADPSLVDDPLHWQALVGTPPRFTNRESTSFDPF